MRFAFGEFTKLTWLAESMVVMAWLPRRRSSKFGPTRLAGRADHCVIRTNAADPSLDNLAWLLFRMTGLTACVASMELLFS